MSTQSIAGGGVTHPGAARLAGAALALASLLAIAGFTVLGSVFEYPQILEEPTAEILALFREHQGAVVAWFLVLVVSAALMAPAGVFLGRLVGGTLGRWIAGVGIAAATVQVVGLQRWVTLVPGVSRDALDPARRADAEERFELLHTVLGKVIGETLGYALTATFTVLVVIALSRTIMPRWMAVVGYTAAGSDRHRRGHPLGRRGQPEQLRGLRGLVRVAAVRCGPAVPGIAQGRAGGVGVAGGDDAAHVASSSSSRGPWTSMKPGERRVPAHMWGRPQPLVETSAASSGGRTTCRDPSYDGCRCANSANWGTRNACSSAEPSRRVNPRAPGTEMWEGPTSTPGSCRISSNSRSWRSRGAFWVCCCCGIVQLTSGLVPRRAGSSPPASVGHGGLGRRSRRGRGVAADEAQRGARSSRPARGPCPPSAGGRRVGAARPSGHRTRPAGSPRSGRGARAG